MSNIYSIGLSGLQAAQIAISTAGENISNSSTTGYDVESVVLTESGGQDTGSGYIGSGVTVATVQRAYSQYITTALNNAQSTNSSLTASYNLATELSNLVGSSTSGIGSSITAFFSGLEDVANSPDELSTRQTALSDAQTLADEINSAGEQYDSIRSSVNTQLTDAVSQINTYTQEIAKLNEQISSASASGDTPNQLLDERDEDVSSLSQLIGVSVVQNSSGYSVFLGNGQPLVVGTQSYSLTTQTSTTNPSELTVAWEGTSSSSSSASASDEQTLSSAALQGGTVGGLISFVSQTLDPAEAQLGAIATSFAAQVNSQNELGLTLSGSAGGALFSVDPSTVYANSGNTGDAAVSVTLTDPASPPTDNYTLSYTGGTYTLTDSTTNTVVGTTTVTPSSTSPFTAAGLSITSTGTMQDGDSFSIEPTAGALDSFAVATTDASSIAAASPVLVSASTTNTGSAAVSDTTVSSGYSIPSTTTTLTYTADTSDDDGTLSGFAAGSTVTVNVPGSTTSTTYTITSDTTTVPYDPSTGAQISISDSTSGSLSGVSFTLTGTPESSDTFTIAANTSATQDGSNALALSDLVSSTSFTGSETLTDAYANYVNSVGNTASSLESSSTSQTALVSQLTTEQQSVSGVNLDEEAAKLLQYQQLYQASSKVIQTAESMFQTLIGIFS